MEKKDDGTIELKQIGLTDRIISTLGLQEAKVKRTPAEYGALPMDKQGPDCEETWSYCSVVCMMIYLASNARSEIAFAVHQCARFNHSPNMIH